MKKPLFGKFKRALALSFAAILSVAALCAAACTNTNSDELTLKDAYTQYKEDHPAYEGSESSWKEALFNGELAKSYDTNYNIVFTLATVPPVLAALDSISSGYETYAMIERGKTYNGITKIDNFNNIGFDTNSNKSSGFTEEQFEDTWQKIKELNVYGNEKFYIYVQDGTALSGLQLAANACLLPNQYEIIVCEDGVGAYVAVRDGYITDKTVAEGVDQVYDTFVDKVTKTQAECDKILAKTDNKYNDYGYDIQPTLALSAIDNFTVWYQDKAQLVNIIKESSNGEYETKLLSYVGADGYTQSVDYKASLKFGGISTYVDLLYGKDKADYLTLMYGDYYAATYQALTRTQIADGTAVPAEKLVFIGTRLKQFPDVASNADYGLGGVSSVSEVPNDYQNLNAKYKSKLLFPTKADYDVFINAINDSANYEGNPSAAQKDAIRVDLFNQYLNYVFVSKLSYALYGAKYDIIMKGHPSEVIEEYEKWSNPYVVEDGAYNYNKLVSNLLVAFHESDSVGKFIGRVPYGTAAENLAYLGADIAIGGLDSSTYTGYDTGVDVEFVMQLTDSDITKNANLNSRYEAGNLTYTDANGESQNTKFLNVGNIYKTVYNLLKDDSSEQTLANIYKQQLEQWLDKNGATDVNDQGIIVQ
ncbi:MAG: hypothetical protein J6B04_03855 [Clostridia bacterium]|nr:hypothetical protein [Clostridia bacterium]